MKRIILALVLSLFPTLFAQPVHACSCAATPPPLRALIEAKAVFVGEVLSKETFEVTDKFGTQPVVRVKFAVSRVWKGVEGAEAIIHTSAYEPACGYRFEKGKKYLVYAYSDRWGLGVLETGICNRTKELRDAATDLRAISKGSKA
jgi:hypothetical protein